MAPKRTWEEEFAAKEARYAKNATARNHLSNLPPPDYKYVDRERFLLDHNNRFYSRPQRQRRRGRHPKLVGKKESGNFTDRLEAYWEELPHHVNMPLAGLARPDQVFRRIKKLNRRLFGPLEALPAPAEDDEFQLAPEILQNRGQLPSPPPNSDDHQPSLTSTSEKEVQTHPPEQFSSEVLISE